MIEIFKSIHSLKHFIYLLNNDDSFCGFILGFLFVIYPILLIPIVKLLNVLIPKKYKELGLKINLSCCVIIFALMVVSCFFEEYQLFIVFLFIAFSIFTFEYMFMIKIPFSKPIKYNLKYPSYEKLQEKIKQDMIKMDYKIIEARNNYVLYCNVNKNTTKYIVDSKFDIITQNKFDTLQEEVLKNIEIKNKDNYQLLFLISVDKMNSSFNTICNQQLIPTVRFYSMNVGISFGSKKVSFPDFGMFNTHQLRNMKEDAMKILDIDRGNDEVK